MITTRFRLPLVAALATAHGTLRARDGVLVTLRANDGTLGFGEAMPLAGFGLESLAEAERALDTIGRTLVGRDPTDLAGALAAVAQAAPLAPSARAAADLALHDLAARLQSLSVAALLAGHGTPHAHVPANGFVAALDPRAAAAEARRLVATGYGTLKLKVGADTELDVARVAAVRAAAGDGVALRLDANGAWTASQAASALDLFARFDPDYVEEPLATPSLAEWSQLAERSAIALAADESVRDESSARELAGSGAVACLVVKPAALGGLAPARRIALAARAAGVRVAVTSFLDSALGRAAGLHLAASLAGPIEAAGLATGSLFAADLAELPSTPQIALPSATGLGIQLERVRVARPASAAIA